MSSSAKKFSWKRVMIFLTLAIVIAVTGLFIFLYGYSHTLITVPKTKKTVTQKSLTQDSLGEAALDYYKAIIDTSDKDIEIIKVSKPEDTVVHFGIDKYAGSNVKKVFDGERINIAITGVDSRIGSSFKHADANHVLSILPDLGKIEIISVPRDTEADAGFPDSTGFNKLTVVRASKGRDGYLKDLAAIAGLDKIHYYVEFGFSQAMGILEWLGYGDAGSQLQVLRSRKGFVEDDFQRTYNQAQFMRQMMFLNFDKFSGLFGDVMLSSGLAMVDSNLDKDKIREILSRLKINGFGETISNVSVKVKPSLRFKFKVFDFSDPLVVKEMQSKVNDYFKYTAHHDDSSATQHETTDVAKLLNKALQKAEKDTASRPTIVINNLKTYFDQRAWLQVKDKAKRDTIREKFNVMLSAAYTKKGDLNNAKNVRDVIDREKKFFKFSNNQIDARQQSTSAKDTLNHANY